MFQTFFKEKSLQYSPKKRYVLSGIYIEKTWRKYNGYLLSAGERSNYIRRFPFL